MYNILLTGKKELSILYCFIHVERRIINYIETTNYIIKNFIVRLD